MMKSLIIIISSSGSSMLIATEDCLLLVFAAVIVSVNRPPSSTCPSYYRLDQSDVYRTSASNQQHQNTQYCIINNPVHSILQSGWLVGKCTFNTDRSNRIYTV